MNTTINLETATISELKAAAYDVLMNMNADQRKLDILNSAVNQKMKSKVEQVEPKSEPKVE